MSSSSDIEWTDATWNPVNGCGLVSPGCENCYAMKFAHRFSGKGRRYEGLTVLGNHGPRWTGDAHPAPWMLGVPLQWKKPRRVFVNSMSDLFHDDVPDEYIAAVFGVMAAAPQHTFQVLTKRAERMARWFDNAPDICASACHYLDSIGFERGGGAAFDPSAWPLPHVWIGVSVEDQRRAAERIPHLLRVPAAVRFLSCEPLLEAVDVSRFLPTRLQPGHAWRECVCAEIDAADRPCVVCTARAGVDWVIVGGESGHGARRFDVEWARQIVQQCKAAGVPVFVKQVGAFVVDRNDRFNTCADTGAPEDWWPLDDVEDVEENINGYRADYQGAPVRIRLANKKGGDPSEWPPDLRVREYPR